MYFFSKNVKRVLFVPYALRKMDHYAEKVQKKLSTWGMLFWSNKLLHTSPNLPTTKNTLQYTYSFNKSVEHCARSYLRCYKKYFIALLMLPTCNAKLVANLSILKCHWQHLFAQTSCEVCYPCKYLYSRLKALSHEYPDMQIFKPEIQVISRSDEAMKCCRFLSGLYSAEIGNVPNSEESY